MKLKTQIIIQVGIWILGMTVDFLLTGHVLIGGSIGATIGLLVIIIYKVGR